MAPESLLRLHILILNVGWSDLGQHVLNVVECFVALGLCSLTDYKWLCLVIGSIDTLLSLIFAMVHLEERIGDPESCAQHHRVEKLEEVMADCAKDGPLQLYIIADVFSCDTQSLG